MQTTQDARTWVERRLLRRLARAESLPDCVRPSTNSSDRLRGLSVAAPGGAGGNAAGFQRATSSISSVQKEKVTRPKDGGSIRVQAVALRSSMFIV